MNRFTCTCFVLFLMAGTRLNAQVRYNTINDTVTFNHPFSIDLNNDSTPDLQFQIDTLSATVIYCYVKLSGVNEVVDSFGFGYPSALYQGQLITASLHWLNYPSNNNSGILGTNPYAEFQGKGNRYLGVKVLKGGNSYYAWVQLNLDADRNRLIIIDAACNLTANTSIIAGQKFSTGVESFMLVKSIQVKTSSKKIETLNSTIGQLMNISVTDITGKIIFHALTTESNVVFDLSDLITGIYIVRIETPDGIFSKKVFLSE